MQYFIWSTDNIGILAAEALLRAADRGVKVRVIVDDMLIDAPDKTLLALARHPNIEIRIYNPMHHVGTPFYKRALNVLTDFRGVNQRMHDKTFIVDGKVGDHRRSQHGGRIFQLRPRLQFSRPRCAASGRGSQNVQASFAAFWNSPLAVPVASRYDGWGLMKKNVHVDAAEVQQVFDDLHDYARSPENLAPEVREAIDATPESFDRLARELAWGRVAFIHDIPGKNDNRWRPNGGGQTSAELAQLVEAARESIVIESPYLVMSDKALALFKTAVARGVKVRILTNSLASTDNFPAFSGYRNQRRKLLKMGLEIHEYKPDPANRKILMSRVNPPDTPPVFALHAKSMVVDGRIAYIGTYNLDPRSENLNTEVGVIVHHPALAKQLQARSKPTCGRRTAGTPPTSPTSTCR